MLRFLPWVRIIFPKTTSLAESLRKEPVNSFPTLQRQITTVSESGEAAIIRMIISLTLVMSLDFWCGLTLCLLAHPMSWTMRLKQISGQKWLILSEEFAIMHA